MQLLLGNIHIDGLVWTTATGALPTFTSQVGCAAHSECAGLHADGGAAQPAPFSPKFPCPQGGRGRFSAGIAAGSGHCQLLTSRPTPDTFLPHAVLPRRCAKAARVLRGLSHSPAAAPPRWVPRMETRELLRHSHRSAAATSVPSRGSHRSGRRRNVGEQVAAMLGSASKSDGGAERSVNLFIYLFTFRLGL